MNSTKKVERRPVPGYEGVYSVTSEGVIYAEARVIEKADGKTQTFKERIKKVRCQSKDGAPSVMFYGYPEAGKSENVPLRSIMQATFPEMFPPIVNLPNEEWRTLSYNPIYSVSNMGRFKRKSCEKTIGGVTFKVQEYLMSTHTNANTNRSIQLRDHNKQYTLHRAAILIYETFVGKIPDGHYIKYRDNDNTNLVLSNLYVGKVTNREHVVQYRDDKGNFICKPKT